MNNYRVPSTELNGQRSLLADVNKRKEQYGQLWPVLEDREACVALARVRR